MVCKFLFFKQKTAYEVRISDWSSDVCSSDLINAACEHIPLLLMSGRTPATEQGRFGARTVPIAWGQEMRDQAAMIRECCKWDYELRLPEQVAGLLDRAHAIASSTPKGPVYLALPRETLCEQAPAEGLEAPPSMAPVLGAPDPAAIAQARSEARRVGKECVRTCRSRWSPYH